MKPFSTKILLNDESGPEFDALKNFNLTEEQKMELLQKMSINMGSEKSSDK